MSAKNKLIAKSIRRENRAAARVHVQSHLAEPGIPKGVSAEILTDPKRKLTSCFRKHMLSSRGCVVELPRLSVESAESQVARKVAAMNVRQLRNALVRCPRKIRVCEQNLAILTSPFQREPLEIALRYFKMLNNEARAEHARRTVTRHESTPGPA